MKRRTTFVHDSASPVNPSDLRTSSNELQIHGLPAAREERLTFAFGELPQELWLVLKQCHELHLRWVTERPYDAAAPFLSRLSPGLHAFYTPARDSKTDILCPFLQRVFGTELKCSSPEKTFTAPHVLSSRFANTSSLQYHSLLPSLGPLVDYIQKHVCPHSSFTCLDAATSLHRLDTLDLDFDSISHSLTLSAYWSHALNPRGGWTETISSPPSEHDSPIEVGILSLEKSGDPYDLTFSGHLITLDASAHPSPTLFSFPSRHHPLPSFQVFYTSFQDPTGLHPSLQITFPTSLSLPASTEGTCALHTYLTLPSGIFPDAYQLSSASVSPSSSSSSNEIVPNPFTLTHRISALRSLTPSSPPPDLEAPVWAYSPWGSAVLLELLSPSPPAPFNATVPLHLRYHRPTSSGTTHLRVPDPIVFWACPAEEGTKFKVNPFDRVDLGWEGIFGPRTAFYQLRNGGGDYRVGGSREALVREVDVPVLKLDSWAAGWVQWGTVVCVLVGWGWLMVLLGRVGWRDWKVWKGEGEEEVQEGMGMGKGEREGKKRQ